MLLRALQPHQQLMGPSGDTAEPRIGPTANTKRIVSERTKRLASDASLQTGLRRTETAYRLCAVRSQH